MRRGRLRTDQPAKGTAVQIPVMLISIAKDTGSARADSGNVRGAKCPKLVQWIWLAENHDRRELVIDHNRSSVKVLPAIRVNRVRVVVGMAAMVMMVGRSIAAPNMHVGAGIDCTSCWNPNGHPKITSNSGWARYKNGNSADDLTGSHGVSFPTS